MRINIKNPADCCGCTACESICPHNAIQMQADQLGFYYPNINNDLCVDCGLCQKVCTFQGNYVPIETFDLPEVYGVRHTNEIELEKSQSGAAFWAFAEYILQDGYVIYGVGYGKDFHVIHKRVETIEACQELRGSKYVQSDLRGIFREIKKSLQNGDKILFTGTPCQVAGLKSYIPKRLQDKLFTIDLVCHAVPSPHVWKEYVKWVESVNKDMVTFLDFRNKKFGWHSYFETFQLKYKQQEIKRSTFRFFFFNDHLAVRPSCPNCKFTNLKRPGDLTIGDFWGWEKSHSEWNDNKGVSLLLVNSNKGKELFRRINGKTLYSIQSNIQECLQPQLIKPIVITGDQKLFIEEFVKFGFVYVGKKYADISRWYRLKLFLQIPKRFIRKIIKAIRK